jgi:hypothetical protein
MPSPSPSSSPSSSPSPSPSQLITSGPDPWKRARDGAAIYGPAYEIGYWDGFRDGQGCGARVESLRFKVIRKAAKTKRLKRRRLRAQQAQQAQRAQRAKKAKKARKARKAKKA